MKQLLKAMASYVTTFCSDTWSTLRGMNYRQLAEQIVALGPPASCALPPPCSHGALPAGLIVTSALVIWKSLMVVTGSESPARCFALAARP